jgi:hypothetical protein
MGERKVAANIRLILSICGRLPMSGLKFSRVAAFWVETTLGLESSLAVAHGF